jgi:exodeoxyribonuclease VII large subunit
VCCSTPTHAAEAAVPVDCHAARADLLAAGRRLEAHARRAIGQRAAMLERLSRAPAHHVARQRRHLHQLARELRAAARRGVERRRERGRVHALVVSRATERARTSDRAARRRDLTRLALALAAHDPDRTLARGYALVEDRAGEPLGSARAARAAGELSLRFHDGTVDAEVSP